MSSGAAHSALTEEDVMKLLATQAHLGSTNLNFQMQQYVYTRRFDGPNIINVKKTWEKLLPAARAIAAVENPADIVVVSARPYAQRALLKFAAHAIFGHFFPGCLTNQIQKTFKDFSSSLTQESATRPSLRLPTSVFQSSLSSTPSLHSS